MALSHFIVIAVVSLTASYGLPTLGAGRLTYTMDGVYQYYNKTAKLINDITPDSVDFLSYFKRKPVEYCFGVIGCIVVDDTWYNELYRRVNLQPDSREKINTRFILHTREFPSHDTMLYAEDVHSIIYSRFNASRPTKFICHGFVDDGNVRWIKRLTRNLLNQGDYNVITVNWGGGSLPLGGLDIYSQATANTRVVGMEIAYLVNTMIEHVGVDPEDVHLIGHSLGAHIVGYAGERIKGLGRITGLDPAEPYFQYLPEHVRLDPTDAKFVDAIHTDSRTILLLGYGMVQPVGHLDFYVNGGMEQPGCHLVDIPLTAITIDMITAGRELVACNHLRAIEFFIDSLLPDAEYIGYECPDYDSFLQGQCYTCGMENRHCAKFGLDAVSYPHISRVNVPLYFKTGKDAPYTQYHYHVSIALDKPKKAEKWVRGKLKVSLFGTKGQIVHSSITPQGAIRLIHGTEYFFLDVSGDDVGRIQRVALEWNYDASVLSPSTICVPLLCNTHLYVKDIEISEMSNYPEKARMDNTFMNCPVDGAFAEIGSGKSVDFYPTACVGRNL